MSLAGLLYLVSPGLTAPPLISAALMAVAGLSWGLYSLSGRGAGDPLRATAANFIGTLPLALLLWLSFADDLHLTAQGAALAVISGALTSGVGYAIWFAAVRGLTASAAASVQLSVPALSAAGGILWLGEPATLRLVLASVLILGGIALVLRRQAPARSATDRPVAARRAAYRARSSGCRASPAWRGEAPDGTLGRLKRNAPRKSSSGA